MFASPRDGDWDIYDVSVSADGALGEAHNLTNGSAANEWDPRFASNGRLAYESDRGGRVDIWLDQTPGRPPSRRSRRQRGGEAARSSASGRATTSASPA